MTLAYLDCFSGISGDMFLGALIDAGLPVDALKKVIGELPIDGYSLEVKKERRGHLSGTAVTIKVNKEKQSARKLSDVRNMIHGAALKQTVKEKSIAVFEKIAFEEGKIHGESPEQVHFHEVGAIDSIIDIVGTVFGLDFFNISTLSASNLPLGSGFVKTMHGRIPVPSPATVAILKGIPIIDSGLEYEMVTPTGAALVKILADSFGSMPPMFIDTIGYGAGSRELPDRPNLLRILIGRENAVKGTETVVMLETNLDDMNPEWFGYIMDQLFDAGALDVVFSPIQMKKNRPGTLVQIMGNPQDLDSLMDILFRESTALGIRYRYNQRRVRKSAIVEIQTPWGKMAAKQTELPNGDKRLIPEYEACKSVATRQGVPLKEIYEWINSTNRNT